MAESQNVSENQENNVKTGSNWILHRIFSRHDYSGLLYDAAKSLRTTDQCIAVPMLKASHSKKTFPSLRSFHKRDDMIISEIENVLTKEECRDIIDNITHFNFQDMSNKYDPKKERNNSRLLVSDKDLSRYLWNQVKDVLERVIQENFIKLCPLGFDVLRGKWELCGLNEAIRVNRYSSDRNEYFAPHKDAQYCPSGDERSIFSLVVYLNEGFQGGNTCYYLPKKPKEQTRAMTVEEEIKAEGGLEDGFDRVTVFPVTGMAVFFSQNILHESTPLVLRETTEYKFILKTDIMLRRKDKPLGFAVGINEKDHYFECLNYFREAQQKELDDETIEAGQLYERAVSLRYCYPAALKKIEHLAPDFLSIPNADIFPACVWENIFSHLNGQDAERLVYAFPDLKPIRTLQEDRFWSKSAKAAYFNNRPMFYPKVDTQHGIYTCFEFPDANFFRENEEGCCRVAAMYSFVLLGHSPSDSMYTVRFNPDSQEICVVPLNKLLLDAFCKRPSYGAIYKVKQQGKIQNLCKDFSESVDRDYMALRHNAEFIGVDVSALFMTKTTEVGDCKSWNDDGDATSDKDSDDCDEDSAGWKKRQKKSRMEKKRRQMEGKAGTECDAFYVDGEIDTTVKNDILLRMMDRIGSIRALKLKDLEETEDERMLETLIEMSECLGSYGQEPVQKSGEEAYMQQILERCSEPTTVSATLVSSLNQSSFVDGYEVCLCGIGGRVGKGCRQFSDSCEINTYNHLVFDFQQSHLTVEQIYDETFGTKDGNYEEPRHDCSDCYLSAVLRNHVKFESYKKIKKAQAHGEMKHFTVNIEPLAKRFVPFNHASCQCGFPDIKVNEYMNFKDYPYLDHVHLITQEIDGKMYVWSVYLGIVAL